MNGLIVFSEILLFCFLCIHSAFAQNPRPSIEEILKKSSTERIQTYSLMLKDNSIDFDTKKPLFKPFASDARYLSPQYGKSSVKMDSPQWIEFLSQGASLFPEDENIIYALTQLLINDQQYERALQVVESYHKRHPYHDTAAWVNYCSQYAKAKFPEKELPVFDIHFCILTNNPAAQKKCTRKQLEREILILNRTFQALNNERLIKFRYKSASFFHDIQVFNSPLEQMTNNGQPFDSNKFNEYYNQCTNPKIRDVNAINFYIYDSYHARTGYKDITSHGRRNSNRPYIVIDWERLNNNVQNPSAHEMGHAFGLGHVAVPGATLKTPTNIMCSTQYGFGSGGNRKLGFTEAQTAIILYHVIRSKQRLSASVP